jgi:hypothetical protein
MQWVNYNRNYHYFVLPKSGTELLRQGTSDFGQAGNPLPPDGLAQFFEVLRKAGLSISDIDKMAKENPAHILGLR